MHFEGNVIRKIRQPDSNRIAFPSSCRGTDDVGPSLGVIEVNSPVGARARDGEGDCLSGEDGPEGPVRRFAGGIPVPADDRILIPNGGTPYRA